MQKLFSDESKWTRFCMARDNTGEPVSSIDPQAVSWCLTGALHKCYGESYLYSKHHESIKEYIKMPLNGITLYNDRIATFKDIQNLVENLDI